ncbi:formylglycine-generating enzyme family protein [Vibrio porteresiae]|uniref:SUMF1/EgtB/PvdO family nonheme iron enzyme n=1 Tax=Vibrio porteresiae DSM 19223 TaxID=1123496 RepID=A0ABZ0QMU5_9VIBR|nr:SUMF1/EgtB/PvdO family nonheme iron enzyme [Vibrio porteresiae]WPC76758.1 SUMF1/EgtB/PvdO family nonheme iron enzyme [Vibrio porteresiae DSM 19223]
MRQGLPALLLALSPCLMVSSTLAEEAPSSVSAIDDALSSQSTDLQDAKKTTQTQQAAYQKQSDELVRLETQAKALDATLQSAKASLQKAYTKMINDPKVDISPIKASYQAAWSDVKQNQKARLDATQKLQDMEAQLAQQKAKENAIQQKIVALGQDKLRARAERLKSELKQTGEQKVSFTNKCDIKMTLAQCADQTKELALQKAVNQYQDWLIDSASETSVIKQNLNKVSLNIHLIKYDMNKAGFVDNNRYQTVLTAQLESRAAETSACTLLGIDNSYCYAVDQNGQPQQKQKEVAWVSLNVRSNQYNDNVVIDDVNYGSTPVEIMLPVGNHLITVEKEGYDSFSQLMGINSDQTLRAVLREQANLLKPGHKFADSLKGNIKAPEMITMIRGEYLVGENASRKIYLDHAFAMSAAPITVGEFETFVNQTGYQTDAELKHLCISVNNSEVTPVSDSYWRNPGFKQTASNPVVCVSKNDAKAYTQWLSKQTGSVYRLPTEDEWEIAARSGSQSDYWWGDDFGADKANTGWGGSTWSNKSTSPVGSFAPNNLGFVDVVGNVWEWTQDPRGMAKGGAWSFSPDMAKASSELFIDPTSAANYLGFRVLRELK